MKGKGIVNTYIVSRKNNLGSDKFNKKKRRENKTSGTEIHPLLSRVKLDLKQSAIGAENKQTQKSGLKVGAEILKGSLKQNKSENSKNNIPLDLNESQDSGVLDTPIPAETKLMTFPAVRVVRKRSLSQQPMESEAEAEPKSGQIRETVAPFQKFDTFTDDSNSSTIDSNAQDYNYMKTNICKISSDSTGKRATNRIKAAVSWYFRSFSGKELEKKSVFMQKMFKSNHGFADRAVMLICLQLTLSEFFLWIDGNFEEKLPLVRLAYMIGIVAMMMLQLIDSIRRSYTIYKALVTIVVLARLALRIFEITYGYKLYDEDIDEAEMM
jgi:hypothetical protein